MFASVHIGLSLKRNALREHDAAFHWVPLTRLDVLWLCDLRLAGLNLSLFYMASICER